MLALCSIVALDRSIEAAAQLAAGCGLGGIEVCARAPHLDPDAGPGAARSVGRNVRDAGVEIVAYGSYLGHAGRQTEAHAQQDVAIAAALETPLLRVWAEPVGPATDDVRPTADLLRAACDAAAGAGITVVVERHFGSFADSRARIVELFERVDRPNLALNYQVLDFLMPEELGKQADDAAALAGRAKYFHLKNYVPNPDGVSCVLHGGSLEGGVLDYRAILGAALAAGYAGPMAIEFLAIDDRPIEAKLAADAAFLRHVLAELSQPPN